jgi:hypothetical protein
LLVRAKILFEQADPAAAVQHELPQRVKLRPAIMSAVTAAFLETGQNGYGAAMPPEAGEGALHKKHSSDVTAPPAALPLEIGEPVRPDDRLAVGREALSFRILSCLISCTNQHRKAALRRSTGGAGGRGGAINALVHPREPATPVKRVVAERGHALFACPCRFGKRTGDGHSSAV